MKENTKYTPNRNIGQLTNPKGFIIHGTFSSYQSAINWLTTLWSDRTDKSKSSAFCVISRKGEITYLANKNDITWHSGNISNPSAQAQKYLIKNPDGSYKNPNEYLIGIELEYLQGQDFTDLQLQSLKYVVDKIAIKNPIILTHSQITDYKGDFGRDNRGIAKVYQLQGYLGVRIG